MNVIEKELLELTDIEVRDETESECSSNFSTATFSPDKINDFMDLNLRIYNKCLFMVTNARSLSPKIISLMDCFEEFRLTLSIVTESWLADGTRLGEDLEELDMGQT